MTPEQKVLREKPDETIAEWDAAINDNEIARLENAARQCRTGEIQAPKWAAFYEERALSLRRLRAALAELKRLRAAAEKP